MLASESKSQRLDVPALFADGITEARTASGMVGIEKVVRRLGEAAPGSAALQSVDALERLITIDSTEVRDDVAALEPACRSACTHLCTC
jgi:serine phosphatase RsbU (regulator of sigma subunit)